MSIYENAKNLIEKVKTINPKAIIVGACKMQSIENILEANSGGIEVFAENKAQEFRDKYPSLSMLKWHFIGSLQKNKVKYLVGKVDLIQSVDKIDVLQEISRLAVKNGITQNILIEVNVGEEESKSGISIDSFDEFYNIALNTPNVIVKGIMGVMPINAPLQLYLRISELYDRIKSANQNIEYLSVGMSGDYEIALKHGANIVRLGTCLFGERDYSKDEVKK